MFSLHAAALIAGALAVAAPAEADPPKIRGMTISCPMYGQVWGTEAFSSALAAVRDLGVEWVALHPYARIERGGRVRFRPAAETGYLDQAVARARKAGIRLFWKPHIAYWGEFDWRGDIRFPDPADRKRFFDTYRAFILDQARFAARHRIPLLSVGVELDGTTQHVDRWRALIEAVRATYPGRLTYAANWDRVMSTPFWDALDLIGAQAYHPLPVEVPTAAAARAAWSGAARAIETLRRRYGKPVLFTEIGYPNAPHAAQTPWRPRGWLEPAAPKLRRVLIQVAARDIERLPGVAGMFWWKWIPGRRTHRDFAMESEVARTALAEVWRRPFGTETAPTPGPDAARPPF